MSDQQPSIGHVVWTDLTVPDADGLKDFYAEVVGLKSEPLDMGGYADYMMQASGEGPAAPGGVGICHARGSNAHLPPQWMIYFGVADLDASLEAVDRLGGKRIGDVRTMGNDRYCAIQDPAGAVCSLYQKQTA